jgi:DNA polymerase III subunit delta
MSSFKPAYLIHGDDHGRIGERRARLRALAEQEGGAAGVEVIESATPADVAAHLGAPTLAIGRRFLIVDGAERWSDADVTKDLAPALAATDPNTTVAFFAREEARAKAPAALHAAVRSAGGDVSAEIAVKEWDLPQWAIARARELDLSLDSSAARALVALVGTRQARLSRELEKLALECGPGARLDADAIAERAGRSAEHRAWTLADAIVARDSAGATIAFLRLRAQGERVESLSYWITRRLREALGVARALERGAAPNTIRGELRMPPRVAAAFIADVSRTDIATLQRAIATLADLELDLRGGSALDEDTLALRAIGAIAA